MHGGRGTPGGERFGYPAAAMQPRPTDPRTEDTLVYELVRTDRASGASEVVGTATFSAGSSTVDAPESVAIAVRELLARGFVDRVRADERPRGYRRSGQGMVDMLVPGMAEHFIARLRGLWLPYPDGSVVTAREPAATGAPSVRPMPAGADAGASVSDPATRRASLAESDSILRSRPLVVANEPLTGLRLAEERTGVARTDCGWIT
jgi:hypothetical protein